MALVSAAPYIALLGESDASLKTYALTTLNEVVDQLWSEIANNITDLEELYEDGSFEKRQLAALIISKVYYNLGDYDASVKYSLSAGDEFNVDEQSQYVETIVSRCISWYTSLSQARFLSGSGDIDPQLTSIFEKMLQRCIDSGELKMGLGIALESYRLELIKAILLDQIYKNEEQTVNLINYVLQATNSVVADSNFRTHVLNALIELLLELKTNIDYFTIFKIIVQLNDFNWATKIFKKLLAEKEKLIVFQSGFDLVNTASQELLLNVIQELKNDEGEEETEYIQIKSKLLYILSGVPTCDLEITFLHNHNNTDISILNKTKNLLDGKLSLHHSAVTFMNAFMHAGTTDDSFFRKNLEWLGKATNWSKFSATAALGVIHMGNLSQGRNVLKPYLPGSSSGSTYTKGGSLFALGLIYTGHGNEINDYLRLFIDDHGNSAGNNDTDVMLHGACLGAGVSGMGSNNDELYRALKVVLYSDSAISGQAAALAIGLVKLGSGDEEAIEELLNYAQETQHENIIRGLAIAIAFLNYGRQEKADPVISKLLNQENSILRYGGAFAVAMAYAGTGRNSAIKTLLHCAVSDPSDNVRRASVLGLGFILIRDPNAVPQIVDLLSQSHNPHVRYGAAMALGISSAGRCLPAALKVLEPLTKDTVDFVRQGALVATSMILIQQNDVTYPKLKDFTSKYANTIRNKHEDGLAKFGATLALGIIEASGRNVTISLEHTQTNTLNVKAIVGLALFCQSWYWYPLVHFLSLSFTPTSIIGIRGSDLRIPKFDILCHTKPELFQYPPKVEESKEKQPDKIATAVLSTTAKAKARAKKKSVKDGKMDVDEESKPSVKEEDEESKTKEGEKETEGDKEKKEKEEATKSDEPLKIRYSKVPYSLDNMSRVLPAQSNFIAFAKDSRFSPVRKLRGNTGIIILKDNDATEKCEFIKTIRQLNINEAPLPEPFYLEGDDLKVDED